MIKLKSVSSGYGKKEVVSSVTASFERGRLTAVIGPNGCGKSTLLKTISGIIPLMSGNITADGGDISKMKRGEIAKKITYLSQGRDVPDMTVSQLVLHGRFPHLSYPRRYGERDREIARLAMERMGIYNLSDERVRDLSGGVRQSAYIAMALAQETDCILFDEPSTYLDISHSLSLMRQMRELAEGGRAIVTVMHDIPMALDFADDVIVMQSGRIVMQGSPCDIVESDVIRDIFGVGVNQRSAGGQTRFEYDY